MLRRMNKNRKEAMGMLALMLPTTLLYGVLQNVDPALLPLASQPLPFGLPEMLGNAPIAGVIFILGKAGTGLMLALLPATMSRKKTLWSGFLLLAVAAFMAIFSRSPFELCCCTFLGGIGLTLTLAAWISIGTTYFPRHCGLIVGFMYCIVVASSIIWATLIAIRHAASEQEKLPLLPALAGLLLLVLLYILIWQLFQQINAADERRFIRHEARTPIGSIWSCGPLLLSLAAICQPSSATYIVDIYEVYLREVLGFPIRSAQMASSLFVICTLLAPLGGWLGDRYGALKTLSLALPITAAIGGLIFTGWHMPLSLLVLLASLMSVGLSAMFYVNLVAALVRTVAPMQSLRILGLFYAANSLGLLVAGVAAAQLKDMFGLTLAAFLQLVCPVMLATVLVWLAQRILTPDDKETLPA